MRALYVGQLNPGGTCLARLCALRELIPDVETFDSDAHMGMEHLSWSRRALESYSHMGPVTARANRALRAAVEEHRPDLIWIDKGDWVWTSTLKAIRVRGAFLVQHNTDALWPRSHSLRFNRRLLRATPGWFDVFLTTNIDDRARIERRSVTITMLTDLGYDDERFEPSPLPSSLREAWASPILFVGHYEPRTEAGILALIEAGLPVTVYGHRPWFASPNRARLGEHLRPQLSDQDYVHAIKGAKIGLCFVSEMNYNETAARSFEIPGCGTFLLAMRTRQHLECYREGKEAEFFGHPRELVEKARYYLEHDEEREKIARSGRERCVASGYSWRAIMKRDWSKVMEIYRQRRSGTITP
jgi:glycosyltransferase involved in cell wall biosynthesis